MAATIPVETESGTYSGRVHPHNGYYAGDFSTSRTGHTGAQGSTCQA
jgi:hypothetical protein